MASKRYEFRTKNEKLQTILDNADSKTQLIEKILTDYVNGQLLQKIDFEKSEEYAQIKMRKMKADAIKSEVDARIKMITELKLSPNQVVETMNSGESILNKTTNELIQNDNSLKCQTCGKIIDARAYEFESIEDYEKHIKEAHNRNLYPTEREQFNRWLGQ